MGIKPDTLTLLIVVTNTPADLHRVLFNHLPIFKNKIFESVYYAWHLHKDFKVEEEDNYVEKTTC